MGAAPEVSRILVIIEMMYFGNDRFVRVLGCAGASRPLVRVLRVVHVVLGVRRCYGAR